MGIVQVEQNRLRQQEIEVKALVALATYGSTPQKFNALKHLEYIAYPEELAKDINQESLEDFADNDPAILFYEEKK